MGRIIAVTAKSTNAVAYAKPRVVYVSEDSLRVIPGNTLTKPTRLQEYTPQFALPSTTHVVYEEAMQVEVMRNPASTDLLLKAFMQTGASGTGTVQGGATAVRTNTYFLEITTLTGGSADAFVLPAATVNAVKVIQNNHATVAAKIFPAVGEKFDISATNAVYSLPAGGRIHLVCLATGVWTIADDFGKVV